MICHIVSEILQSFLAKIDDYWGHTLEMQNICPTSFWKLASFWALRCPWEHPSFLLPFGPFHSPEIYAIMPQVPTIDGRVTKSLPISDHRKYRRLSPGNDRFLHLPINHPNKWKSPRLVRLPLWYLIIYNKLLYLSGLRSWSNYALSHRPLKS